MEKEMNYELTPRGDRVLIKIKEAKEVTKGGIILPKSVQEKTQEGIVLEVGSLVEELNIGDTIIFINPTTLIEINTIIIDISSDLIYTVKGSTR